MSRYVSPQVRAHETNPPNPLLRSCGANGENCYDKFHKPHTERFCHCFTRGCNFGDVDGLIDNEGRAFLMLEQKSPGDALPGAQMKSFQHITQACPTLAVLILFAGSEYDYISEYRIVFGGQQVLVDTRGPGGIPFAEIEDVIMRWWDSPEVVMNEWSQMPQK
jgi:hypothetical protein